MSRRFFGWVRHFLSGEAPSTWVKQLPTAAAFLTALAIVWLVPELEFTNVPVVLAASALLAIATALAVLFSVERRMEHLSLLVPLIDLVAIGALQSGTGGIGSLFSPIIVLPVVWIAAEAGRRYIAVAAAGSAVALLMPFVFTLNLPHTVDDWVRETFTPFVIVLAAAIINEIARRGRAQTDAARAIADENELNLRRAVQYAVQVKESEQKLREYERMFRGVWAAVTEQSVIGTDVTGLIDAWNPGATAILGYTAEEAEDRLHVFDFHVQEELMEQARELNYPPGATVLNPGFSALVERARLGHAESREWNYIRKDGSLVPVQLSVTKRVDEFDEITGYLFVATDVTKAREVARLKDEFVGLISHELRTPLSSILGYLELMRDDEDNPLSAEQIQYLGVAERNAHRLLRLVGDLLFTAQVESGKFPLDSQDLELEQIVSAAVESARPIAAAAGVELKREWADARLFVHGDPVRLGQACDNLISNALKFTPRGGTVTIGLTAREGEAVITVADTGIGIAASELDQLFSRFFRATTATRNAVPGVGLGLTITKAIVTAHHGGMDVQSEEGVGTRFSVALPLARSLALTPA